MHHLVRSQLECIHPSSPDEAAQLQDALAWVNSGAALCRTEKPATPPKHLVSYFPVVDGEYVLLVDHKNAKRWLPPGGHVEPGEDPRTTVVRELREELGLVATESEIPMPLMVTVTETVGLASGHTDVSLWYPLKRSREEPLNFDPAEFHGVQWFHFSEAPLNNSDPNLGHFLAKLRAGA
jgi:8-oxo-dGTP diphosphatase